MSFIDKMSQDEYESLPFLSGRPRREETFRPTLRLLTSHGHVDLMVCGDEHGRQGFTREDWISGALPSWTDADTGFRWGWRKATEI